jgi:hypothetical protein
MALPFSLARRQTFGARATRAQFAVRRLHPGGTQQRVWMHACAHHKWAAGHPTEAIGVLIGHRSATTYAASETGIECCPMATRGTGRGGYYKTQSKFVRHDHPFGNDARFRKGLPSLQDILDAPEDRCANNAFKKLARLKVDPEEIGNLLVMIGASSDELIVWPRGKQRNAEQVLEKFRKLAAGVERAIHEWPFGTRMMYSDYIGLTELPGILRSHANAWEKQLEHPYRSVRTARNENILRLLEYVKSKTGKHHYEEVAELLNATDAAYGWESRDGNPRWSAQNLRDIEFRAK